MADTSWLVTKITFVVAEITLKVVVVISSVVRITFLVVEMTCKVAVFNSSVVKITLWLLR